MLNLSQAFLEKVTPLPTLASKAKERAPSLITWPRRQKFKGISQILFLLLCLDPKCRNKDQCYYLGTMKRLNQSRVHLGTNNDLKNQCSEDFDRLVTFQLILQVISVWGVCSSQELPPVFCAEINCSFNCSWPNICRNYYRTWTEYINQSGSLNLWIFNGNTPLEACRNQKEVVHGHRFFL